MRIPITVKGRLNSLLARHTPFGGREAELKQLHTFVSTRSMGYLLVTAQPGFGKTALLANWIKTFPCTGQDVCYHFISRLDGVADEEIALLNLCQQLAAFHELGGELPTRTVELRSLYRQLLSTPPPTARRLIVVLDGLEEALNWTSDPGPDLFPYPLPEGVFVVFSAPEVSDVDWLAKLELDPDTVSTLRLTTLGTGEITSLLKSAGHIAAQCAQNPAFISTLHDISEGDPLYLHFLVEDVQRGRITEKNVNQQPSGLNGYLEKWWKQLDEDVDVTRQETNALLGVLTIARGPLRVAELAGITPTLAKGMLLKRELSGELRRYLIGNGHDGYALCHPRFADYLKKIFLPAEQQAFRDQLLGYCEHWREHKSAYTLSHYPAHLFELDRDDELFALINKDWMEAQFERVFSHSAFSADIELAIRAALKTITQASLVQIVRNSLVYATLGSLTKNVPLAALAVLAQVGQRDKAVGYAGLIPDRHQQIEAFCRIGRALARRNKMNEARAILERATNAAEAIEAWHYGRMEPGYSGSPVLAEIASAQMELGDADRAAALAERAVALALDVPGSPRNAVLASVATTLAQAGLVDHAISAEEAIDHMQERTPPLAAILRTLVRSGLADRAEDLCAGLNSEWYQILHLVELVEALAQAGEHERAAQAADQAAAVAEVAPAHWFKALLVAQAARASGRAGKQDQAVRLANEAVAMAKRIDDALQRAWALAGVARGLAQAGQNELALEVVAAVRGAETRPSAHRAEGRALWEVAKSLARAGDSEQALALAARSQELIQALHDNGAMPLEYALPELDDINNILNVTPLIEVIRIIAEVGQVDRAWAATEAISPRRDSTSAQYQIVEVLVRAGQLDRALEVTRAINDRTVRAQALARVATAMAREGNDSVAAQVANRALTEAQVVDDPWNATWALVDVVNILAEAGQMAEAFKAAEAIGDGEAKAWAFFDLGNALAKSGKHQRICEVIDRTLEAADHVESRWELSSRIRARAVMVPTDGGKLFLMAAKPRNVIGPGAKRALEAGAVIGSFSLTDQANVKALMLPEIVRVLARIGEIERAAQIVDRIVVQALAADNTEKLGDRNFILAQAGGALAWLGKAEAARQAAEAINNPWRAASVLAAVAGAFARSGQEEQAVAVADQAVAAVQLLRGTEQYSEVLAKIVTTLTQAGQIERALAGVDDVDAIVRALLGQRRALETVVQILRQSGDSDRAAEMVDRADPIAAGNADHLAELIIVLVRAGRHERVAEIASQAKAAVEALEDPASKGEGFVRLANVFVQVGAHQQAGEAASWAVAAAETIENPRDRSMVQVDATRILVGIGQVDQALAVAFGITHLTFRTTALFFVRVLLNEAGQKERAVELASRIADIAATIENPSDRAQSFVTAAKALGGVGEGGQSVLALVNALLSARAAGRLDLFRTLQEIAPLLASIDECHTLWEIHESLLEVDGWWSATD